MPVTDVSFSGSYDARDVVFLLKPIAIPPIAIEEKEALIRSGRRHYSEMLGVERQPSPAYLTVFRDAHARNLSRFAADVRRLAAHIAASRRGDITLLSLARAGTPVGVLLGRILRQHHGRRAEHFSISIIRDRGIDENALRHVLGPLGRAPDSVVFVDGWTGKGVIAAELARALHAFSRRHGVTLPDELHVVADLCGAAAVAATAEDYLIPSAVLNATISGLVSRSVLNQDYIGQYDFHGCVYYQELEDHDLSRWFIDSVMTAAATVGAGGGMVGAALRQQLGERSRYFLATTLEREGLASHHDVKPGIGECTRALLRRVPAKILVRAMSSLEVQHILLLARERQVPVLEDPSLPYEAAAILGPARRRS